MNIPDNLRYTATHEWVQKQLDGTVRVGITDHAQDLLGDMVFVEGPATGRHLSMKEECAVVESVKAASDVYAPIAGTVVMANAVLDTTPESLNTDAYGTWLFSLQPDNLADVDTLLDAAAYRELLASESH